MYQRLDYHPAYEANLLQIDHIFPQSVLRTIKKINPTTGYKVLKYCQFKRDQIANCMLLTAQENKEKNDTLPEEWFNKKDKQYDKYLNLHLIPQDPELWKLDNYEQFIEARKKLILEKFSFMIQTDV